MNGITRGTLAMIVGLGLAFGVQDPASAEERPLNFRARLSGAEEVPEVETRARGQAVFQLSKDQTELHFMLIVANIENVEQAHIHLGARGVNGPVVAWLYPEGPPPELISGRFSGVLAVGTITEDDLVQPEDDEDFDFDTLIDLMLDGRTYVNVHTTQFQAGEIRGQIEFGGFSEDE